MNLPTPKKLFGMLVVAAVVIVALSWTWRSDAVQELLRPERYWINKVVLIEIEVDLLRNKVMECAASLQKLRGAGQGKPDAAQGASGPLPDSLETLYTLCTTYDNDLKAAVESLVAAKKKLQQAKD